VRLWLFAFLIGLSAALLLIFSRNQPPIDLEKTSECQHDGFRVALRSISWDGDEVVVDFILQDLRDRNAIHGIIRSSVEVEFLFWDAEGKLMIGGREELELVFARQNQVSAPARWLGFKKEVHFVSRTFKVLTSSKNIQIAIRLNLNDMLAPSNSPYIKDPLLTTNPVRLPPGRGQKM
jgi:hypothetical protein